MQAGCLELVEHSVNIVVITVGGPSQGTLCFQMGPNLHPVCRKCAHGQNVLYPTRWSSPKA